MLLEDPHGHNNEPFPQDRGVGVRDQGSVGPGFGAVTGMGGYGVVRVGLLGRSGAGACPNLPQRHLAAGLAAKRSTEYQRFSFGASPGSKSLWQIWTIRAAMNPREGRHGPGGGHCGRADDRTGPREGRSVREIVT